MEEIEISSWMTLDAIKEAGQVIETVGDLQSGHWQSIFCTIEDDYLELGYMDTESNFLRRYDDKEEFKLAIEKRKEDVGEASFQEDRGFDEDYEDDDDSDEELDFPIDEENF